MKFPGTARSKGRDCPSQAPRLPCETGPVRIGTTFSGFRPRLSRSAVAVAAIAPRRPRAPLPGRYLKETATLFPATLAGSLPKPSWLAETSKLWPQWRAQGEQLAEAKRDATLLWLKLQEDAGLDIVGNGEQSRQHFVHGFLEAVEGTDFEHKVEIGIRADRYKAMVPQVVGPLRLRGRVHATEARLTRAHTGKQLKFTLPGPMTIVDTVADRHYGDRVKLAFAFAELLKQ